MNSFLARASFTVSPFRYWKGSSSYRKIPAVSAARRTSSGETRGARMAAAPRAFAWSAVGMIAPRPGRPFSRQKLRSASRLSSRSLIPEPNTTPILLGIRDQPVGLLDGLVSHVGRRRRCSGVGKEEALELGEAFEPLGLLCMPTFFDQPPGEGVEQKRVLTRRHPQMGVRDARQRCGERIDDDDPRPLRLDGFPHLVRQEVVVDQQIRAGDDDQIAPGKPVVPAGETDPPLPERGGHLPRVVEGGRGDRGLGEAPGYLGDEKQLFVGDAGGDDEPDPLPCRGKALQLLGRDRERPPPSPASLSFR